MTTLGTAVALSFEFGAEDNSELLIYNYDLTMHITSNSLKCYSDIL